MTETIDPDSVGIVTPQTYQFDTPLEMSCGRVLQNYELVVETYGELNADRSNAVLICHALSGSHHAAGFHSKDDRKAGWWDAYIGPGKAIDTQRFFVACANNLGGCHGSTGPNSINPDTNKPWGPDFPRLGVQDWVHSQHALMEKLGINCWAAIIGGSLGGMQAMRWALEYPDEIRHCIVIAGATKLSAQNIAFNEVARQAILSDRDFHGGRYLEHDCIPKKGLALARMVGHITYLSDDAMADKFGRDLRSGSFQKGTSEQVEFQVESYLRYQGDAFSDAFDANTYLLMTKALDYFDLAREYNDDPVTAFSHAQCAFMIIAFTSDWRFPPRRSKEIVNALIGANKPTCYAEIESRFGHDAFLLPNLRYQQVISAYMQRIMQEES